MFSTTYLPTFCLLVLVLMTFYFPEDNFQVRATVALSCLLILSTLFGSTSRSLPTTTQLTFVEIWMMFAVLLTFAQVILHTVIGYVKEMEKANSQAQILKIKVNSVNSSAALNSSGNTGNGGKRLCSRRLNQDCGRIIFPILFLLCTLTYALIAIVHRGQKDGDLPSDLILNNCRND